MKFHPGVYPFIYLLIESSQFKNDLLDKRQQSCLLGSYPKKP